MGCYPHEAILEYSPRWSLDSGGGEAEAVDRLDIGSWRRGAGERIRTTLKDSWKGAYLKQRERERES